MHRPPIVAVFAVWVTTLQVAHPIFANQDAAQALRTLFGGPLPADLRYEQLADGVIVYNSKVVHADFDQQTLRAFNPTSKYINNVFPDDDYISPFGAAVMARIDNLRGRVDEADRNALIASKAGAGFDRAITSWRAHAGGRSVVLAVRYYRDQLFRLELEITDDYGRADPVDPARYEFFAIAVCSRAGVQAWTCVEEPLADVAGRHHVTLPPDRAGRIAAAEKIVDLLARP